MVTKEELIEFEAEVCQMFNDGKLRSPVHLSGGNEDQVIEIFKQIKPTDWVFSTYRSHYHTLLHGIDKEWLRNWILDNKSIHVMNSEHKFITSAIVGGTLPTALGVAMGINLKNHKFRNNERFVEANGLTSGALNGKPVRLDDTHVFVFIGDMTGHTGVFWECINYAHNHKLPITFVIEDNGLSTDTPTAEVWNILNEIYYERLKRIFPKRIIHYKYTRTYPHYGTNVFVKKLWDDLKDVRSKGF